MFRVPLLNHKKLARMGWNTCILATVGNRTASAIISLLASASLPPSNTTRLKARAEAIFSARPLFIASDTTTLPAARYLGRESFVSLFPRAWFSLASQQFLGGMAEFLR